MANIILIEDIVRMQRHSAVHELLERQEHKVVRVMANEDELLVPIPESDIAVINVGRACGAGYSLTAQLRRANGRMAIMLLAATQESAALRIAGLERGADFCECLPERTELLNAVVDVLLRRVAPAAWRIDTLARTLRAPQRNAVELNSREMALLKLLASSPRYVAERSAIARAFGIEWNSFDERLLEKTVSRLRRKWRDSAQFELPLRTLHGVGYCFTEAIQVC